MSNNGAFLIVLLFNVVFYVLTFYVWVLIASALVSTLISFGVLDSRNRLVWTVADFLFRVTEPVLRPIRRVMPNFGNVDLSPLIALALIQIVIVPILHRVEESLVIGMS